MARNASSYRAALRTTLHRTDAAYGYTLTIAMTAGALMAVHGPPRTGELFLFVAGGLGAFAVLDGAVHAIPSRAGNDPPEPTLPFAGAMSLVAVGAALGVATALAHLVHPAVAWLLAPMAATCVYLLLVAGQIIAVTAHRR